MYRIYSTKTFERRLKQFLKRHPELENTVAEKLDLVIEDPFGSGLKTHKLSGRLMRNWAISLTYEYRILFIIEGEDIYLTNIGSHDEVY